MPATRALPPEFQTLLDAYVAAILASLDGTGSKKARRAARAALVEYVAPLIEAQTARAVSPAPGGEAPTVGTMIVRLALEERPDVDTPMWCQAVAAMGHIEAELASLRALRDAAERWAEADAAYNAHDDLDLRECADLDAWGATRERLYHEKIIARAAVLEIARAALASAPASHSNQSDE